MEDVLTDAPKLGQVRPILGRIHRGRAEALQQLRRHQDAVRDWERAAELDVARALPYQVQRAYALARAGKPAEAVAAAGELTQAEKTPRDALYEMACVCALASLDAQNHPVNTDAYRARAVELLRCAVARGYRDLKQLKSNKHFDVLRSRDDFQKLLQELMDSSEP